jgi:hypothetical protein
MVYLWDIPNEYPEKLIGEYDRENSPDRFLFKKGELLPEDIGRPTFKFDADIAELKKLDDLSNNAMVPVISDRLASILIEVASKDIQLIDIVIKAKDGELEGYKLLNIINKVIGIDKSQSKFTFVPGTDQIMSFRYLKYKDGCLGEHALARDEEYSSNLIVSQALVEKLRELKVTGVALYLPEDIEW